MSKTDTQSALSGLRVCHVGPHLPRRGGVSIQTHLTEDGLRREGAEVHSVDTILHWLSHPVLLPVRMLLQPLVTACRFVKAASRSDVIHLQICSWWGFLPVLTCAPINRLFFRKPMVATFHGARGHLFVRKHHWWAVPFLRLIDRIAVVSPELESAFEEYGISARQMNVVIDLSSFRFRERAELAPNFVWVRQFESMYDPMATIDVFTAVQKEFPKATLTMIGAGSMRPDVERCVAHRSLAGVRFTGILPNTKLPAEFDKADIFINTSVNDGQPAAVLEAAASGLPIVTTAAGGIPDMIEDGAEGIILPIGDVDAMVEAIISLLRDPERARSLSRAARANAERHGWDAYAAELVSFYGIAGERGAVAAQEKVRS